MPLLTKMNLRIYLDLFRILQIAVCLRIPIRPHRLQAEIASGYSPIFALLSPF
jgi:hypothetical protein